MYFLLFQVRGKALLLIIVLGLGGSFPMGCNITSSETHAVCPQYIQRFINSSWTHRYGEAPVENTVTFIWSAVTSVFALGALFGSISRAMICNNAINMILLARFLFGLTSGLGFSIHVLYLGDCSPKKIRGTVTLSTAIFLSSGKLTGQVMGISEILGREDWWNILLSVPAFFSIIQMVTLPFFPEAPRYLLIEKGNTEECKKALQCLWGPGDYKLEIEEMLVEKDAMKGERSKTLLELLRDQRVRWQLLTVFFINVAIQFCGISAFSVFAFSIFEEAGIPVDKIRYVTMGIGTCEVLTNITCVSSNLHNFVLCLNTYLDGISFSGRHL
uniref:Solute carrier family 2 member 9, like 1 n=1 Tax=Astyanax mexicanus TaxID=7994 RepID=W5LFL2_ASTMX